MRLTLENISKLYGDTIALEHINLTLEHGIYGLLGPNGAGKTTLMRVMADLLVPSTGRVLLDGQDIAVMGGCSAGNSAIFRRILVCIQTSPQSSFCFILQD